MGTPYVYFVFHMNNIAKYRKQEKISQKQFAYQCGWSASRLSNYENGYRTVSVQTARIILTNLNSAGVECCFYDVFPSA